MIRFSLNMMRLVLRATRFVLKLGISVCLTRQAGAAFMIRKPLVIDGDTLFHAGHRIRLQGIDAPELTQKGGEDAKNQLIRLIGTSPLRVEPRGVDVYGRTVARVLAGRKDIGLAMVASGYAISKQPSYSSAERGARWGRKGMWSRGGISDPAAWRRRTA